MNTLITGILTVVILIVVLRSELTPWRIVSQDEIDRQVAAATAVAVAAAAQSSAPRRGAWMNDPHRRTQLDQSASGVSLSPAHR